MTKRTDIPKTLIIVAILTMQVCAQEGKPWRVDHLCGRLENVQSVPMSKGKIKEKKNALRDVSLSLYERADGQRCCNGLNAAKVVQTNRGGHFDFKTVKPGNYWLVANWNGKEYKTPVAYKPERNSSTLCSGQGIQFDDEGKANWFATITVD